MTVDQPVHPLPLTGERTVPGVADETYWFQRHVVAYRLAAPLVAGARVLDAGCGEGYGLALLAQAGAEHVTGADLDAATVAHARATYGGPAIEVVECELMQLPLADGSIDTTVSFQVIEHVHDVGGYLASLRRVTRANGHVLLATPNRLTFTPDSDTPVNPFHVLEFTADELATRAAAAGFVVEEVLGVHHGPRLRTLEDELGEPFMQRMTTQPATDWPTDYRALVHGVEVEDFTVHADDLDASLDLVAVCRVP